MVEYTMNLCENRIIFCDLLNKLKKKTGAEDDIIRKFLVTLIDNEYLLTELRPALTDINPIIHILDIIKKNEDALLLYNKIREIHLMIEKYNVTKIGEGIQIYYNIIKLMKNMVESSNYIQVDMKIEGQNKITLSKKISESIEKFVSLMIQISEDSSKNRLFNYMNRFEEKYGEYQEVKLVEVLDEDIGIGKYSEIDINYDDRRYISSTRRKEEICLFLYNKMFKVLRENKKNVKISLEEIENIVNKFSINKINDLPESLEVYASIIAESCKSVDDGDFIIQLGIANGSSSVGKSFGRFSGVLGKECNMLIENSFSKETSLSQDIVIANINEIPVNGRLANVVLGSCSRAYEINISVDDMNKLKTISIDDLYIGIENGKFYIKSKILNKHIKVKTNNMLNYNYRSDISKFLLDISEADNTQIFSFLYYNELFMLDYIPRITFENIIVVPEQWKLSLKRLKEENKKWDIINFEKYLRIWIRDNKIPQIIYIQEQLYSDNKLLINLNNADHIQILFNILTKNYDRDVTIMETAGIERKLISQTETEKYFSEFVIPLFMKEDYKYSELSTIEKIYPTKSEYKKNRSKIDNSKIERGLLPGDEWLYIKFVDISNKVNLFIANEMLVFCEKLIFEKKISKYFFIRYNDGGRSIRLRVKLMDRLSEELLLEFNLWFKKLRKEAYITDVEFATYYKEVERYGGEVLISYAEEIFCEDSTFVANILKMIANKKLNMKMEEIAIVGIIHILNELNIKYDIQKEIFEYLYPRSKNRDIFNKKRATYIKIADLENLWNIDELQEDEKIIKEMLLKKNKSLNIFSKVMNEVDSYGELTNSKVDITLSIIHMFCNRLNGDREFEDKVMSLVRHSLQAREYWKKN